MQFLRDNIEAASCQAVVYGLVIKAMVVHQLVLMVPSVFSIFSKQKANCHFLARLPPLFDPRFGECCTDSYNTIANSHASFRRRQFFTFWQMDGSSESAFQRLH